MTEEEQDLQGLQRLFDDTVASPSGPVLTKLGARALDIPERARRMSLWARPGIWWLAAMALASAAVVWLAGSKPGRPEAAPLASAAPSRGLAVAMTTAQELGEVGPRVAPAANEEDSDDSLELVGDADEGARFDVSGPKSDRDLDAWLAAAREVSGGS